MLQWFLLLEDFAALRDFLDPVKHSVSVDSLTEILAPEQNHQLLKLSSVGKILP